MRYESPPDALNQRRLVNSDSMNLARVAVNWQLTGLSNSMTAIDQKSLWRWRNKITMHTLTICEMSLRLLCDVVPNWLSIFSCVQLLNSHRIDLSLNNNRLSMSIVTDNNLLLLFLLLLWRWFGYPRRWSSLVLALSQTQTGQDSSLTLNVHNSNIW